MSTQPTSASEAMDMVRAGLGYLAAADATAMAAETQAQCLQALEQAQSVGTAARTSILAAFTSGQGYSADADYSPRAWLIHKTHVTKGAAVGYTAWVRRAAAHPEIAQALAAGDGPGVGRADHLRLDGQAARRSASRTRMRSCWGRRRAARMWRTWPGWPGRSTPAPSPKTRTRTRRRRSRTGP